MKHLIVVLFLISPFARAQDAPSGAGCQSAQAEMEKRCLTSTENQILKKSWDRFNSFANLMRSGANNTSVTLCGQMKGATESVVGGGPNEKDKGDLNLVIEQCQYAYNSNSNPNSCVSRCGPVDANPDDHPCKKGKDRLEQLKRDRLAVLAAKEKAEKCYADAGGSGGGDKSESADTGGEAQGDQAQGEGGGGGGDPMAALAGMMNQQKKEKEPVNCDANPNKPECQAKASCLTGGPEKAQEPACKCLLLNQCGGDDAPEKTALDQGQDSTSEGGGSSSNDSYADSSGSSGQSEFGGHKGASGGYGYGGGGGGGGGATMRGSMTSANEHGVLFGEDPGQQGAKVNNGRQGGGGSMASGSKSGGSASANYGSYDPVSGNWIPHSMTKLKGQNQRLPTSQDRASNLSPDDPRRQILWEPRTVLFRYVNKIYLSKFRLVPAN